MPAAIESVEQLEDLLSTPTQGAIDALAAHTGDLMILGVGGKMGPTLAKMAKRASDAAGVKRRIIGVSRFSSGGLQKQLESFGLETIRADLLDPKALEALPDAPLIIYMAGMKFGSTGNEALTWAMNTFLPGMVGRRYASSRIAAFSTGNIYGLVPVTGGGAIETDAPNPAGEYAMSCLGRERMFQHFSQTLGTPVSIIRLNYAVELRYGVLVDLAQQVWAGQPINLAMGNANVIWQGDANAMVLQSLAPASSPAFPLNVAGPETVSVRRVCETFGKLMNKPVTFVGQLAPDALLNNGQLGHRLCGYPRVGLEQMIQWIVPWIMSGRELLGKPTHFEVRDGKF